MTAMTVMPSEAMSESEPRMSLETVESRPEVGSSKNMREGWATSSRPILTRLR